MLLNVWNSVLRAEIKSTKPFIRSAEFLWQEGHTAHSSEAEAEQEVMQILLAYQEVMQDSSRYSGLYRKEKRQGKVRRCGLHDDLGGNDA